MNILLLNPWLKLVVLRRRCVFRRAGCFSRRCRLTRSIVEEAIHFVLYIVEWVTV